MIQDSKGLSPNLQEWQRNLLDALLKNAKSENHQPVYPHLRRPGKSWIQRWLNENALQISKLNERKSVLPLPITKERINTLAQKNKPRISVDKKTNPFIIYDECNFHVDEEMIRMLRQITDKMKVSVAQTPKSEYNIYINSEQRKETIWDALANHSQQK